ncbi:glycoside hydrolase family 18 protein [Spiractinospora alimapuensis]|uniref:glycoside hydrolase family 18 protein n=1 Tax=Spiractinospora alimapuensis TaxID=2820884 RepID=UPI001F1A08B5|nr:glycoside hydrolase family 18 protein [Spiractinospora alimapuensis]QVQ53577.1 glycoside hydrolase family 18 protein [Spiractinospora alimapuensis]
MSETRSRPRLPKLRGTRLPIAIIVAVVLGALFFTTFVVIDMRASSQDHDRERVAYFADWNVANRGYTIREMDESGAAERLSTLLWAFGDVNTDGECHVMDHQAWELYQRRYDSDNSVIGRSDTYEQPLAGSVNQLRLLREKYPDLRAGISLGGWNLSQNFSTAAATEESRQAFVSSCIDLWIRGDLPKLPGEPQGGDGVAEGVFTGIDLDWEWPAGNGRSDNITSEDDKENFTLLAQEFRRQLDDYARETGREVFLSASLPQDEGLMRDGVEEEVFDTLDFAMIQGYDMNGAWSSRAAPHSQLHTPRDAPDDRSAASADAAVRRYLDHGLDPEKLVLGFPAFGRGWEGVGSENDGRFQPASGGAPGTYGEHTRSYADLSRFEGERFHDEASGASWIYNGYEWWAYDSPEVIHQKGAYVIDEGLGGLMQWNLDQDPDAELVRAMDDSLGG